MRSVVKIMVASRSCRKQLLNEADELASFLLVKFQKEIEGCCQSAGTFIKDQNADDINKY